MFTYLVIQFFSKLQITLSNRDRKKRNGRPNCKPRFARGPDFLGLALNFYVSLFFFFFHEARGEKAQNCRLASLIAAFPTLKCSWLQYIPLAQSLHESTYIPLEQSLQESKYIPLAYSLELTGKQSCNSYRSPLFSLSGVHPDYRH